MNAPGIVLPVAVGSQVVARCRAAGATLRWAKLSSTNVMEEASAPGVSFAADRQGGYIFPSFLPAYDAVAALVQCLSLLAVTSQRLSRVVAGLPAVRLVHETVVTPWDHKGMVMRTILEHSSDREVELVDGVKVLYDDGWALVLPDPEEPITHVWAEGPTDPDARARAQEYTRRIRNLIRT